MIFLHTEGVLLNCKRRGEQSANDSSVSLGFCRGFILGSCTVLTYAKRLTEQVYATSNKKLLQYDEKNTALSFVPKLILWAGFEHLTQ